MISTGVLRSMYTLIAVIVAIFGGIVILAGAAILIYGIKTRVRERTDCTLSTFGIVKEKLYDESVLRVGSEVSYGAEYTTGLRCSGRKCNRTQIGIRGTNH
jgi:hypothetical protein